MLEKRLITGLVMAMVMAAAALWLPHLTLAALLLVVVLMGGWEWAALTGLGHVVARITFLIALGVCAWLAWLIAVSHQTPLVILGAALWWVLVLVILACYQPHRPATLTRQIPLRIAGVFTLVPAWLAMVRLHEIQPIMLLFLFVLIWSADTSAYFIGKLFGKTQLAPELSPGKTREGLWAALGLTLVLGTIGAFGFNFSPLQRLYFIGLCLVTTLFSVAGDLFESLLKRRSGVKDSGNILPGHGGVLDRIDSLTAAAPVFVLGFHWMYWSEKYLLK
jgi:phosphatidate cytidylyltransferase